MKKLYRSEKDIKIAGVCGGIAEYFSLDPTLVRLLWLLAIFFAFSGFWAYIIAVLIIPKRPFADTGSWQGKAGPDGQNNDSYADAENNSYKDTGNGGESMDQDYKDTGRTYDDGGPVRASYKGRNNTLLIIGLILVVIGSISLARNIVPNIWAIFRTYLWPIVLVLAGIIILISAFAKDK
jgi:phage shock protein C